MKDIQAFFAGLTLIFTLLTVSVPATGQDLPEQMYFSEDGRRLLSGGVAAQGYYVLDSVLDLRLDFHDPDFWSFMKENFGTEEYALATLSYEGKVLDSVAVAFKGQTSYTKALEQGSTKLSFSIKLDQYIQGQDIDGYNNLNLNNAFGDASFMREVLYGQLSGMMVPALKGNYVRLWLNGEDWGLYPNIQQLNGDFIKEWFPDKQGIRWRADNPGNTDPPRQPNSVEDISEPRPGGGGPGGGGGGQWGDGTAALNYLGEDAGSYENYYTMKDTDLDDPWSYLVRVCRVLNETPLEALEDSLGSYMDLDATLWFLAQEILFSDDDSYVYKGKMDYYLFMEESTGLMLPLEFDGNSAMGTKNQTWSPFLNEDNVNYPLLNRLLAVPGLRQRYIAHARTLLENAFDQDHFRALITQLNTLIRDEVISDPVSTVTTTQYDNAVTQLRSFLRTRRDFLLSQEAFMAESPLIGEPVQWVDGMEASAPGEGEACTIAVSATHGEGISGLRLYYGTGLRGTFESLEMRDDGLAPDRNAGDGLFSASIPAFGAGTLVRYYIEALAGNTEQTAAYMPEGAAYDVFAYRVPYADSEVDGLVINELLASNDLIMADEAGEFDDWVEIHNSSANDIRLGGYRLSDDAFDMAKWTFPDTLIEAGAYLVVWTDNDEEQGPLHASFKLSADGEEVLLSDPEGKIVDQATFEPQTSDISLGRWPDATGPFLSMAPTFQAPNEWQLTWAPEEQEETAFLVYPNPCTDRVYIRISGEEEGPLTLYNAMGQLVMKEAFSESLDLSALPAGMYILKYGARSTLLQKH